MYKKIEAVHKKYTDLMGLIEEGKLDEVFKEIGVNDNVQATTFALTWTFLQEGMGLNAIQAAGVMGNIAQESRFSTTNAQDKDEKGNPLYPGIDNPEYSYSVEESGITYGLFQWKYHTRKRNLLEISKEMGMSVGNINVQFRCIRSESKSEQFYISEWNQLKACESYEEATRIVFDEIEECEDNSLETRKRYSREIYITINEAMKSLYGSEVI